MEKHPILKMIITMTASGARFSNPCRLAALYSENSFSAILKRNLFLTFSFHCYFGGFTCVLGNGSEHAPDILPYVRVPERAWTHDASVTAYVSQKSRGMFQCFKLHMSQKPDAVLTRRLRHLRKTFPPLPGPRSPRHVPEECRFNYLRFSMFGPHRKRRK